MNQMNSKNVSETRRGERGEGQLKVVIFLAAVFLGGYAGFQYIPVAYNGATLKQEMQTIVDQSSAIPAAQSNMVGWVQRKLESTLPAYGVPKNAALEVQTIEGAGVTASLKYTAQVDILPFGLYTYPYEFKNTVSTSGMLTK